MDNLDPLATSSSGVGTGLKLARGAALRFWLTFILGGSVVGVALGGALGDCGGPEWGGFGIVVIVIKDVASALFGGGAGLSHGVAVFLLRRTFAVMITSHQVAASTLTALAVLVVGFVVLLVLGPPEDAGGPLFSLVGLLAFVLSILVVP